MNREELRDILKTNLCEVTFTKVNGEIRVMPCTLMENELPPQTATATENSKINEETLSVWCLDKKQWRSFRVSNVIKVEVLKNE
jgi:hypothetical protein